VVATTEIAAAAIAPHRRASARDMSESFEKRW